MPSIIGIHTFGNNDDSWRGLWGILLWQHHHYCYWDMTKFLIYSNDLIFPLGSSWCAGLKTMRGNYISCPPLLALTPGATMMSFGEDCEACLYDNNTIIATEIWLKFGNFHKTWYSHGGHLWVLCWKPCSGIASHAFLCWHWHLGQQWWALERVLRHACMETTPLLPLRYDWILENFTRPDIPPAVMFGCWITT